ncbi:MULTISPECIES: hypothetical protein [unclassified Streptomyces]|uniref:hypothetical protein n=1 Tax=unclassified Streptomyces TaxID=2593676 RepID=UPI000BAC4D9F|nr:MULTISPECIES: hypothetical protein [unclassified Streptomyces]ASY34436.1 hypothetical protein CAC01_18660 [Streptomyces sp. CLI2509]MYX23156.1 hypothetical protein [Streptomyces sp. SID8380]
MRSDGDQYNEFSGEGRGPVFQFRNWYGDYRPLVVSPRPTEDARAVAARQVRQARARRRFLWLTVCWVAMFSLLPLGLLVLFVLPLMDGLSGGLLRMPPPDDAVPLRLAAYVVGWMLLTLPVTAARTRARHEAEHGTTLPWRQALTRAERRD